MSRLVEAIRRAIRESDQSSYQIAKGARVSRSQLSRLMSGERGLSVEGIERLTDYMGLRITIESKAKGRKER